MTISRFTSWFLDLLRVVSAIGVVFAHLSTTRLAPGMAWIQPYGHLMVVCFFVLSGFLIAASVEGRRLGLGRYTALRLGRLWSVALPCMLVTLLLHLLAQNVVPEAFNAYQRGFAFVRYVLVTFFVNEVWFLSAATPLNAPVWSLAYEAWYYALFGVAVFVRDRLWRGILLVGLALMAGPKILLLFPIWLLGVALWKKLRERTRLQPWAWPVLVLSVLTIAIWVLVHPRWPQMVGYKPWFFSASWISDFIFGAAVAGVIMGVDVLWGSRQITGRADTWVRKAAGVSFTLYLLHYPLMAVAAMVLPYDRSSVWQVGAILVAIFVFTFVFGSWIEPQRKLWTAKIEDVIRLAKARRQVPKIAPGVRA